jgi:ADP-ribose pyrophosphatase YjhB (NUDIX family)
MKPKLTRRAAAIVYRFEAGQVRYLWVSTKADPRRLVLPAGFIRGDEAPEAVAARRIAKEAGLTARVDRYVGHYLHDKPNGKVYLTDVYLARCEAAHHAQRRRDVRWLTIEQMRGSDHYFRPATLGLVEKVHARLTKPAAMAA